MSQRMPDYEALRERQARAQESIVIGTACSCYITDGEYWRRHGHNIESDFEPNPDCAIHFPERTTL